MELNDRTKVIKQYFLEKIGRKARDFRKSRLITLEQMAKIVGMSTNQISRFERGVTDSAYILSRYIEEGLVL